MIRHSLIIWVIIAALALAGCGQKEGGASTDNYSAKENYSTPDAGKSDTSESLSTQPKAPSDTGSGPQSSRAITVLSSLPELVAFETIEIKGKTRPGNRIFIEGLEVPLSAGGEFNFPYNLKVGKNEIKVVTLGKDKILENRTITLERRPLPPRLTVIAPDRSDGESIIITGQTERGCVVYANGNPARPDREGNFTAPVQLKEGANNIKITSTNRDGGTAVVEKTVTFTPARPLLQVIIPEDAAGKQITISGITDTNTVLVLYVNDIKTGINQQNGIFSGSVTLVDGVNSVTITAINKWGKTNTVRGNIYYKSQ